MQQRRSQEAACALRLWHGGGRLQLHSRFDLSLGAAASWLMLLMCLLLCLFFIAVIRRRETN